MFVAKRNTAKPFYIVFDGVAGLSITTKLSKNGGSSNTVSPTINDLGGGLYAITPITSHRDTLGHQAWTFSATGQSDRWYAEQVVEYDPESIAVGANTVSPLDAGGVRSAIGLPSANLNTQLTNLNTGLTELTNGIDAIDFITADHVWEYSSRSLTDKIGFALTTGERTNIAAAVWAYGNRTLTAFGTLVSDLVTSVWNAASRTLTAFGFETNLASETNATANKVDLLTAINNIDGGSNDTINVTILPATVRQSELQSGSRLRAYTRQRSPIFASVYDATGLVPVDLTGRVLEVVIAHLDHTELLTVPSSQITITGTDNNTFYFDPPEQLVMKSQLLSWSIRDHDSVLSSGELEIIYAP